MATLEDKKAVLNKILQSKDFIGSAIYSNLLSYLVDASLSDTTPKEITIAIDVFGKDADFNSNKDSIVRYHIHMLRKKLDNYYKTEGQGDRLKLVIPKGHYEIKFIPLKSHSQTNLNPALSFLKRWEIAIIFLLIAFNIYLFYRQTNLGQQTSLQNHPHSVDPKDPVWGSFQENGYPISIIIGDDFLLDEFNPRLKRYRQIRDWEIDSQNDLNEFLIQYPKENIWRSEISGFPYGGENNLLDILPIVFRIQENVTIKMSSRISLEDIRQQNIIFMGEFKNLRILNKILYKLPFRFQYQPDERLFLINENNDTLNTYLRIEAPYDQTNKYNVDYSLLVKMPGFTNEVFIFIVGFGYGGRLERTKMLSNFTMRSQFISEVVKINKNFPEYFIALFEVKAIERTGFSNEIKYFKEISEDFFK